MVSKCASVKLWKHLGSYGCTQEAGVAGDNNFAEYYTCLVLSNLPHAYIT